MGGPTSQAACCADPFPCPALQNVTLKWLVTEDQLFVGSYAGPPSFVMSNNHALSGGAIVAISSISGSLT